MGLPISAGLRENFEVGFLFLVIDLAITVLLLPFVLRRSESKRWQPMRFEIVDALLTCHLRTLAALETDFKCIFEYYLSQHIMERQGQEAQSTDSVYEALSRGHDDLRQNIDLLAPAIEPGMAAAIVRLIRLPINVSDHLREIETYLGDLLYFDEARGPRIQITDRFRAGINEDILRIAHQLDQASYELHTLIAQSSIPIPEAKGLRDRLMNATERQMEIMNAAGGLMELLIHRVFHYFENERYDTLGSWLGAHPLTDYQAQALVTFGDDQVIAAYAARYAARYRTW